MESRRNTIWKAITAPQHWDIAVFLLLISPTHLYGWQLRMVSNVNAPVSLAHELPSPVIDAYKTDLQIGMQDYRLCASDVILVKFPFAPAFNQRLTIQPDGVATLAGIGNIRLEGLTTREALESIQSGYARILDAPLVTIELEDFKKPYFIVVGEVNKPGKYDLRGFTSVTEALGAAGGFGKDAKLSSVLLFRRSGNDWYEVKPLNLKRLFTGREVTEDVQLRPGDMLVVPSTAFSRIRRLIP